MLLSNSIKKLFQYNGVELEFEQEALEQVAEIALKNKTGARGLRKVLEDSMLEIMYDVPSKEEIKSCLITKDVIDKKSEPQYNFKTPAMKRKKTKKQIA